MGLPWLNNAVAPGPIRHNYYGFPDENYLKTNDDIMTLKVEHEFSPSVNLHMIARAANYPRQAQITEPQICSNAPASVPVGGVVATLPTSAVNPALPCPYTGSSDPSTIAGEPEPDPDQECRGRSVGPDGGDGAVQVARRQERAGGRSGRRAGDIESDTVELYDQQASIPCLRRP